MGGKAFFTDKSYNISKRNKINLKYCPKVFEMFPEEKKKRLGNTIFLIFNWITNTIIYDYHVNINY